TSTLRVEGSRRTVRRHSRCGRPGCGLAGSRKRAVAGCPSYRVVKHLPREGTSPRRPRLFRLPCGVVPPAARVTERNRSHRESVTGANGPRPAVGTRPFVRSLLHSRPVASALIALGCLLLRLVTFDYGTFFQLRAVPNHDMYQAAPFFAASMH